MPFIRSWELGEGAGIESLIILSEILIHQINNHGFKRMLVILVDFIRACDAIYRKLKQLIDKAISLRLRKRF